MLKHSYFILICALTAVDIILLLGSIKNKDKKAVNSFIFFVVLVIIAHVFYGASLVIQALTVKYFVHELKFLGVAFFSVGFYVMYMRLFDKHNMLRKRNIALVSIVPAISVLLAVSNNYHHLFRERLYVVENAYGSFIGVENGPFFLPYIIYSYAMFIFVICIIIRAYMKMPRVYRMQLGITAMAAIITLIINFVSISGVLFNDFGDATLISFTFAATIQFYGLVLFKPTGMIKMARGLAINEIKDPLVAFDDKNIFLDANIAAFEMFRLDSGLSRRDFLSLQLGLPALDAELSESGFERGDSWFSVKRKDIYDEDGVFSVSVIIVSDITETQIRERELERTANIDYLTGLANRNSYLRELGRLKDADIPVSIAHFNISGMKAINRSRGNEQGDEVIKRVADVLARLRPSGFCARLGGDEFALLLRNTDREDAAAAIEEAEHSLKDVSLASGLAVKQSNLDNINIIDKLSMDNMHMNKLIRHSTAMGRGE